MARASIIVTCFTVLASLFSAASAIDVIVPLYIYPGNSQVNWQPLLNAVQSYPSVEFVIVINPDSGPGSGTYPDSNYIAGIKKLHSYKNTYLIGYVHTLYTKVPLSTLNANVSKYANWAKYPGGGISISGIYFDEVPNSGDYASLQYMASASQYAHSLISNAFVAYNPGTTTSASYFTRLYPNLIVQFEAPPANWKGDATIAGFAGPADLTGVQVYSESSLSNLQTIVQQCKAKGIAAVYVTLDCCYQTLTDVAAVAAALK